MTNDWRSHKERSTPFMLRLIVSLAMNLKRPFMRPFLYPIVAYFLLTGGAARKASREYLRRTLGHEPSWHDQWRHFFAFASCTLDRIFMLGERFEGIDIEVHRPENVRALVARNPSCLLFVAHFGSAEALRVMGVNKRGLPLSILLDREHGRMLTELLEQVNPQLATNIIDASERGPNLVLKLKEVLEAGRMVGIMADRALATERSIEVDFLGDRARLPVGPWLLAHALQAPIILGFGCYVGDNRYAVHFELFAEKVRLPRVDREAAIKQLAQRYAKRLEYYAHLAPYNWFNFYNYWPTGPVANNADSLDDELASATSMTPLALSAYTVTSALGAGRKAHLQALRAGRTGLRKIQFDTNTLDCWLGEVVGFNTPLPAQWQDWDCRNNRLALFALQQDDFLSAVDRLRTRYDADRIGVFIGTSTSGVQHTELAYRERDPATQVLPEWFQHRYSQNIFSIADFVARVLALSGPALAISTACSSSAKVFAAARRAIAAGTCDAAIVGGVDSLCLTTLYGFNSLQLVSSEMCRPADAARGGISIGEAAGFAVLDPQADTSVALLGYGETSDAYHMSSPDPDGQGAVASMRAALECAQLDADGIDYINLHGTGTMANDSAEGRAICTVFGTMKPCSSTKGWTGHTLGAAGIVEAAIALLCIEHGFMPRSLNTRTKDPGIEAAILLEDRDAPVRRVMSNSFGFGGSNCTLILGRPV